MYHFENKILMSCGNEARPAVISIATFLKDFESQTCENATFATFRQAHCAACRSGLQNFSGKIMASFTLECSVGLQPEEAFFSGDPLSIFSLQ